VTLASVLTTKTLFGGDAGSLEEVVININKHIAADPGNPFEAQWITVNGSGVNTPFVDNVEIETFLHKMIRLNPAARASIFDLQDDPFFQDVAMSEVSKVPPTPCLQRIEHFNRHTDFGPLRRNKGIARSWEDMVAWLNYVRYYESYPSEITIMAVELAGRYFLIHPDVALSKIRLVACASVHLSANFANCVIPLSDIADMVKDDDYTDKEIAEMSVKILAELRYDLCAKTGYDEIYRHRGLIPLKVLKTAVDLLQLAYTRLSMFVDPDTPRITLVVALTYHNVHYVYGQDISDVKIDKLKALFKIFFENYDHPIMDLLGDAKGVIKGF